MKKLYILFIPFLFLFSACEKVKLEDSERGKLLLGKWKYQYGGYHTSNLNFVTSVNPEVDFEIEFLEGAKISSNSSGILEDNRIRMFNDIEYPAYAAWRSRLHYGKEKDKLSFEVHYYSEDSIAIDILPHNAYSPSQYNGLNVFSRIE